MRKFCACLSLLSFSLFLSACQVITTLRGSTSSPNEQSASSPTPNENYPGAAPSSTPGGENSVSSNCILLSFEEKQIVVEMQNNSAASDFMEQLPLTLQFEDYNGTEKISYLSESLSTEDAPYSCDPDVGTFAYYAPWGNICLFYEDFSHSNGLVPLGTVISGTELLTELDQAESVTITRA